MFDVEGANVTIVPQTSAPGIDLMVMFQTIFNLGFTRITTGVITNRVSTDIYT